MRDLMRKIAEVSAEHDGAPVKRLTVRLGVFSHLSPSHFREHFDAVKTGTAAEGAEVEVVACDDQTADHALGVVLESLEL
jgi:hydrogenase nickel incorporation protein HypA/HybF